MTPQTSTLTRTTFEWARIQSNNDWIAPILATVLILFLVRALYRRDAAELSRGVARLLLGLRTAAVLALLIFYLHPQWRVEQERRIDSRVALLVDTSLSMGLRDADGSSRANQIVDALEQSNFIERLRRRNEVAIYTFAESLQQVAIFKKLGPDAAPNDTPPADLRAALAPTGIETRLGQSLVRLLREQRGNPIAGVIVVSDGSQNAGIGPDAALAAADDMKTPIHAVGVGSDQKPARVRLSDFVVPTRAYPGDQYSVTGYLQTYQLAGQAATVQLFTKAADDTAPGDGTLAASRDVVLGDDGEVLPVRFELTPSQPGRATLTLRVVAPEADDDPSDNHREADVEIVDHKNRVLLFAGGPMREYRFLRNQLYRDVSTTVDVLLQSAPPGVSQDANAVLETFPSTRQEMFQYDCVVAFDPEWQQLSDIQIDLLETWVAEQGGGLVVIAGSVNAGNPIGSWMQDARMAKIRALYPAVFPRRYSAEPDGYIAKEPWPLDFTREGREAEYLWLGDDAATSSRTWSEFAGVYSVYPVHEVKPGAAVLARFGDPRAAADSAPVYMATQFYGSGRVFYLGSAEMWRLRKNDEAAFETLYTKLLRHISQGRLLRGSARGVLLVERDRYLLGNSVEVRAMPTDSRLEPLVADHVAMQVMTPRGAVQTVSLQADASRAGAFAGRFTATEEGAYRLELTIPESGNDRLSRRIQVNMPELERENPERNDALLGRLAESTGGHYYQTPGEAFDITAPTALAEQLPDRTKTITMTVASDRQWERTWLAWLVFVVCGLLCLEWTIRRLMKLA